MSSFVPFHTKLSSIMGVFVNAAVTQICELVDEGYAVLHLEISRSQKENADLREKMLKMEMGHALRGLENITPIQHERTHVSALAADTSHALEGDGSSNQRPSEPELTACTEDSPSTKTGPVSNSTEKALERISILIKEEVQEEDLEVVWPQKDLSPLGLDGESSGAEEEDRMDIIGLNPANHGSEDYGFNVKGDAVERSPVQHRHPDHLPAALGSPSFQTGLNKSTFPSPGDDAEDPASCSTAVDISPSYFIPSSEKHSLSLDDRGAADTLFPVDFHGVKPEIVLVDSDAFSKTSHGNTLLEHTDAPASNSRPIPRYLDSEGNFGNFAERRFLNIQRNQRDSRVGRKLTAPHRHLPPLSQMASRLPLLDDMAGRSSNREKRYSCGFCGKSFTCPKYLQSHQRVHTGEKPFSCSQCGKRFGQAGYLKKHQNIHTGMKPYGCPLCGKRFADASNLIRHKSVHTAEKSFICVHCGERFAVKHNLRIHLERNHPGLSGPQAAGGH